MDLNKKQNKKEQGGNNVHKENFKGTNDVDPENEKF